MLELPDTADCYIPDGLEPEPALKRTTHLGMGAHQDDLEIFAYHGIETCYSREDAWFTGITVTDGAGAPRSGPYAAWSDKAIRERRRREQRQAANLGGYAAQLQLGHASSDVKQREFPALVESLTTVLHASEPDTVYLHNPFDRHKTHVAVLHHCLKALRNLPMAKRPRKVYGCEVWRDLDWLPEELKVPLPADRRPHLATALIGVFDSQIAGGKRYDHAALGRRSANATFHDSHQGDQSDALIWAIDLSGLMQDDAPALENFAAAVIDRFRDDIMNTLDPYTS